MSMIIKITYLGQLAEVTNLEEESFEFTNGLVSDLVAALYKKYPDLKNKDFQVAQNHELVQNHTTLTGEDIALLPPFSGG